MSLARKFAFRERVPDERISAPLVSGSPFVPETGPIFCSMIGDAFQTYGRINGEQCAASFAYYVFFSLFPLILLLVVVGTFFIPDRLQAAHQVVQQVEAYVPLQTKDKAVLVEPSIMPLRTAGEPEYSGF